MRLAGVVFLASTAFGQTYHFSVAAGSGILTGTNRDAARTLVERREAMRAIREADAAAKVQPAAAIAG